MGNGGGSGPSPSASGAPGGPQGDGPAPPPPTQPRQSATAPCTDCPLQVNKPCDVEELKVQVTGVDENGAWEKVLPPVKTRKVRRLDAVTDVEDAETLRLLQQYDLLIDCLADPDAPDMRGPIPAKITVDTRYHGRHCSPQQHARILLTDLYEHETEVTDAVGQPMVKVGPAEYTALMSWIDRGVDRGGAFDSVTNVFGIIKALWDRTAERGISIDAESCGIRARGDGNAPNQKLRALVRVYRKSKWDVGISIPPFGSFTDTEAGAMDFRGETSRTSTTSASAGFNAYQRDTSSERRGEGVLGEYEHTEQRQLLGDVSRHEQARTVEDGSVTRTYREQHSRAAGREMVSRDGSFTSADLQQRLSRAHGFEVIVSFNDTEVQIGEAVEKAKEQINRIIEVIRNFKKLFDAMPQIGWSFTFDVSVFAGKILLEWQATYGDGPLADGRYLPVLWDLHGRVDIDVIDLTLKLSFGVDLRWLGTGVVCLIEGSITLKASLGFNFTFGPFEDTKEFEVGVDAAAKLAAIASASVLGFTLVDAELSVDGGITLRRGKLIVSWKQRKFDLQGTLYSKSILLRGFIRRKWWWDKKIDPPKVILEERRLHEFQ